MDGPVSLQPRNTRQQEFIEPVIRHLGEVALPCGIVSVKIFPQQRLNPRLLFCVPVLSLRRPGIQTVSFFIVGDPAAADQQLIFRQIQEEGELGLRRQVFLRFTLRMIHNTDKGIIQQRGQRPIIKFLQMIPPHPETEKPRSICHRAERIQHLHLPGLHPAQIMPVQVVHGAGTFQHNGDHSRNHDPAKLPRCIQNLVDCQGETHLRVPDGDHLAFDIIRFIRIFAKLAVRQLVKLIQCRAGQGLLRLNHQGNRPLPWARFGIQLFIHVLHLGYPTLDKGQPGLCLRRKIQTSEVDGLRFGQLQTFSLFPCAQQFPQVPQHQHLSILLSHFERYLGNPFLNHYTGSQQYIRLFRRLFLCFPFFLPGLRRMQIFKKLLCRVICQVFLRQLFRKTDHLLKNEKLVAAERLLRESRNIMKEAVAADLQLLILIQYRCGNLSFTNGLVII